MMTVVMRPFDGPDGRLISGQLVDSSEWRNEYLLLDQSYLRPATEVEIANAEEVEVEAPAIPIRLPRAKKSAGR